MFGINTGDGLTGRHYASFIQVNDPITHVGKDEWWENDFGGFLEDSWKVNPKLTINMGLRYEIQLTPQPPRPNTLSPLNAIMTSHINQDSNNFGPRIGIAWNPKKDTVVRIGYGMFYGKTTNSTFYAYRVENGIFQQTFSCASPQPRPVRACRSPTCCSLLPDRALTAPFPGALTPTVTPISLPLTTQLVRGLTRDFVNPLVHEGDVTIERQLPGNMSLVRRVGCSAAALHLPVFVDGNLGPAIGTKTYAVLHPNGTLANIPPVPWYPAGDRIDPTTGDILTGYSVVNSWYNALVLSLRRPMSHGVEFLANYTFSKSTDDGAVCGANGTFNGTDWPLDPHNIKQENGLSDNYQKHRFTRSVIYTPHQLPQVEQQGREGTARWLGVLSGL